MSDRNNTAKSGILGFISGFAGGKVDEANLYRDEALRLRIEESKVLKERRILKLRNDFGLQVRDEQLTADSILDPQGNLDTSALDEDLATGANRANIRDRMKEQIKRDTDRTKQNEAIIKIPGGNTVGTGSQIKEKLKEGSFTTPRIQTAGDVRTQLGVAKGNARREIELNAGNFTDSKRASLGEASLSDIDTTGEPESLAYRAMINTQATSNVFSKADDSLATNPNEFGQLSSSVLVDNIKQESKKIDSGFRAVVAALQEDMAAEVAKDPSLTVKEKEDIAKKLSKDAKRALQERGIWHETMGDILVNSLINANTGIFSN